MSYRPGDDHLLSQLSVRERAALCLNGALRLTDNHDFLLWCSFLCTMVWTGAVSLDLFGSWRTNFKWIDLLIISCFSTFLHCQFIRPIGPANTSAVRAWVQSTRKLFLFLIVATVFGISALFMATSEPAVSVAELNELNLLARAAAAPDLAKSYELAATTGRRNNGGLATTFITAATVATLVVLHLFVHAGALLRLGRWAFRSLVCAPKTFWTAACKAPRLTAFLWGKTRSAFRAFLHLVFTPPTPDASSSPARPSLIRQLQGAALADDELRAKLERKAIALETATSSADPKPPTRL